MAVINLAITIPDAQMARVQAALKAHWAVAGQPALTNAEVVEKLRMSLISNIKDICKRTEEDAAKATALATVTEVGAA